MPQPAGTRTASGRSQSAEIESVPQEEGGLGGSMRDIRGGLLGGGRVGRRKDSMMEAMVKSAARSIGSQVGREIIRGVLGSILKR
jgi:hypothetical protein